MDDDELHPDGLIILKSQHFFLQRLALSSTNPSTHLPTLGTTYSSLSYHSCFDFGAAKPLLTSDHSYHGLTAQARSCHHGRADRGGHN